jgi:hypothetical protein
VLLSEVVFLKQFGERRTGTNYLRQLLSENFTNVVVLMHVLGDKHSAPGRLSPPDTVSPQAAFQWVRELTLSSCAKSTIAGDEGQEEYLRSIAVPLMDAARREDLGFVLSVKDPYAWGASLCKFFQWLPRGLPRATPAASSVGPRLPTWIRQMEAASCEKLSAACFAFNAKHRAWLEYLEGFPSRSTIVKYEDLLARPADILDGIQGKHRLKQGARRIESISREISWADWDHLDAPLLKSDFDADYYRQHRYLQRLTPAMVDTITKSTDWGLMSCLGYRPI